MDLLFQEETMPIPGTHNNRTPLTPVQHDDQEPVGKQGGKDVLEVRGKGLRVHSSDSRYESTVPRKRKLGNMKIKSAPPQKKLIRSSHQDKENLDLSITGTAIPLKSKGAKSKAAQEALPERSQAAALSKNQPAEQVDTDGLSEELRQSFLAWNDAISGAKNYTSAVVEHLFDENYPKGDAKEAKAKASAKIDALLANPESNLAKFESTLLETWKQTASPAHIDVLKSKLKGRLVVAWARMSGGDLYKLQVVTEALCLQPGGGHYQTRELKEFIKHQDRVLEEFRDGFIYDGENAVDPLQPGGKVHRSNKKVISVESSYLRSEPGTVRNDRNPDISLSNVNDPSGLKVESDLVIKNAAGGVVTDSVSFSEGSYSWHGASVEMELRDEKIAGQLKSRNPNEDGEFAARIRAYINHHLSHDRDIKDLGIGADANICLFDDDPDSGVRNLKPGVQEILDEHHLALIVPSGRVTRGRPISDQLHKNAKATGLSGYRDSMLLMEPVTSENLQTFRKLGHDSVLKEDIFFPRKTLEGDDINQSRPEEPESITHRLLEDRNQFSLDFKDRVMTDHAVIVGPNYIVGNTADAKGIATEVKKLTYGESESAEVWGHERPSEDQYNELTGGTARVLAGLFNEIVAKTAAKEKGS